MRTAPLLGPAASVLRKLSDPEALRKGDAACLRAASTLRRDYAGLSAEDRSPILVVVKHRLRSNMCLMLAANRLNIYPLMFMDYTTVCAERRRRVVIAASGKKKGQPASINMIGRL